MIYYCPCEGEKVSVLSSPGQASKESLGCVEGVLVEIERDEMADDRGEEIWEEEACEFRIVMDASVRDTKDKAVKTGGEDAVEGIGV